MNIGKKKSCLVFISLTVPSTGLKTKKLNIKGL